MSKARITRRVSVRNCRRNPQVVANPCSFCAVVPIGWCGNQVDPLPFSRYSVAVQLLRSLTIAVSIIAPLSAQGVQAGQPTGATAPAMTLMIPGFPDGGVIPVKFGQYAPGVALGEGTSPAIVWANAPAGTQSFFLNMHDMDVVRNKTTDDQAHWVVWNIPAKATGLPEGVPKGSELPDGSYQISATGPMYRGPGAGANGPLHHYVFELYALDTKLDVKPSADAFETRANVIKAIQGHILAKAVYGGLFRKSQ
jgi:Raf kinase inhibitor-like YbhB/YbcL family protein